MEKIISLAAAAAKLSDGMSIMVGGFMGCGNAHHMVQAMIEADIKDITLIANDASLPGFGIGLLVEQKRVRKLIASHVGLNPAVAAQMNSGEMEVELVPQGTLIEQIRAGGAGLGGALTRTGLGTPVQEGKQTIDIDGITYLLEKPLRADVALINGYQVDKIGNVWYRGTTRTFNVYMAMAADLVIAEADNIVEVGDIAPEDVVTESVLVDYIVQGGNW